MPDPTPDAQPAPAPTAAPKPAPAKATPVPQKPETKPALSAIADKPPEPAPEPPKVADEIDNENVIQTWFEPDNGLWYARIGPDRLGIQGQGRDPNEALAECVSLIYRGGWIFDPSWKPKS